MATQKSCLLLLATATNNFKLQARWKLACSLATLRIAGKVDLSQFIVVAV